jgi:hypothetical protein
MADRYKAMLAVCIVLILIAIGLAGWGVYVSVTNGDDVSEIHDILDAQKDAAARDECRAEIQSRFDDVVRMRDAIGWSAIPQLIGIHAGTPAELTATAQALDVANVRVLALPTLDEAVNQGYSLDGVHYPPCPKPITR